MRFWGNLHFTLGKLIKLLFWRLKRAGSLSFPKKNPWEPWDPSKTVPARIFHIGNFKADKDRSHWVTEHTQRGHKSEPEKHALPQAPLSPQQILVLCLGRVLRLVIWTGNVPKTCVYVCWHACRTTLYYLVNIFRTSRLLLFYLFLKG